MPYESMSELVDRLAAALAENQQLRADLARVTAERDAAIHDLQGVCNGECSGDPGAGWPACELWMYGEPDEHGHPTRGHCKYAPPHNYVGEEAVGGPIISPEATGTLLRCLVESRTA